MTGIRRGIESSRRQSLLQEPGGSLSFPSITEVLDNGLTVIAHRDRKAPIVAVYVAYHAGSRDEPAGKGGLAHLYEHLMYCGSQRFPGNTFRHLEKIGATSINAISREDYTAYFATVPKGSLDHALTIEAERMQSNCFDQKEFDRQREVVRNELLQREGEPYGSINRLIAEHAYPQEHPYSHPADGTIAGLDRLCLDDAQSWYRTHYRPANSVVVVAGDIAPKAAIDRVRHHFGKLRNAGVSEQPSINVPKPKRLRRVVIKERTDADRVYLVWNVPSFATEEYPRLELLVQILAGGSDSWLSKRLISDAQVATVVGGEARPREFGSQVVLWANPRAGVSIRQLCAEVERAIGQLSDAPIATIVINRARARFFARLAQDAERLCGPRSRVELLGTSWLMSGERDAHKERLARIASTSSDELCELASTWLDTPALLLEARGSEGCRSKGRTEPQSQGNGSLQRVVLSVSRKTASSTRPLAIRHAGSPTWAVHLVIEGGSKDDPEGRSGLAAIALAALTDQTLQRGRAAITERLERLNGMIEVRAFHDACVVRLSSLASDAGETVDLLRALLNRRVIEDSVVEGARARQLTTIQAEKSRPFDLAMRLMPTLLYGRASRYARPPSGFASEVAQVTLEEVAALLSRWRSVSAKRVIAVGPQTQEGLISLSKRLSVSTPRTPRAATPAVTAPLSGSRIIVVHAPERKQTAVLASRAIGPRSDDSFAALTAADTILGGSFCSRLNMNLREDKGWCYGARSAISTWRTAGLWTAYTFVEPERTVATMEEIEREWRTIGKITSSELANAADLMTRRAAGEAETTAQVAAAAEDLIVAGLPRSWYRELHARLRKLHPEDIADACTAIADRPLAWVILGDAASLVPAIQHTGLGAMEVIGDRNSLP